MRPNAGSQAMATFNGLAPKTVSTKLRADCESDLLRSAILTDGAGKPAVTIDPPLLLGARSSAASCTGTEPIGLTEGADKPAVAIDPGFDLPPLLGAHNSATSCTGAEPTGPTEGASKPAVAIDPPPLLGAHNSLLFHAL